MENGDDQDFIFDPNEIDEEEEDELEEEEEYEIENTGFIPNKKMKIEEKNDKFNFASNSNFFL